MATIVHISEKNVGLFLPMIPDYIKEEIMTDEDILLFGIEDDEAAAGVCVARLIAPEAHILWYYLHESLRGMGIGLAGFMELSELFKSNYGVDFITMGIPAEGGEKIERMIGGLPVTTGSLPECHISTTVGKMRSSKRLSAASKNSISLLELDEKKLRAFCGELKNKGLDLVPMPIDKKAYAANLSAVCMKEDMPVGILLISKDEGSLSIPYLATLTQSPTVLNDMMCFVKEKTMRLRDDVPLSMNLVDKKLKKIVSVFLDIKEDDEAFIHSKRAVIDLSFLEEAEDEVKNQILLWEELRKYEGRAV